ncbi:MAG: response regulator [bacterium]|nr:response regulator [bacterium]
MNSSILIVDDESVIRDSYEQVLSHKYSVKLAENGETAITLLQRESFDAVILDLKMPGLSGMDVLKKIKEINPDTIVIVITGYATVESAVEAMKLGAYDYIPKPFTPEELRIVIRRALEKRRSSLEAKRLKEEKERMRQNFISLVSHELRTPIVAVMQYLEVLSGGVAGRVSEEQSKIINRMKIRLNELLSLIERWLKLSRVEELKLKEGFKELVISSVVNEVVDLVNPIAKEKNISLKVKSIANNIVVNGNKGMIKEVFTNLISNGIKYNREGGSVIVESREEGNFWVIDVSDTGIGIPEQEIAHIGEEFYRIKREGVAAGSGLGLAIVKKILDIHDGRLEIKSKLNQGSRFSVYLPKIM